MLAVFGDPNSRQNGLYFLTPDGKLTRWIKLPKDRPPRWVEFDTLGTFFGGRLFVSARDPDPTYRIWSVEPDGKCRLFCQGTRPQWGTSGMTFGPDGTMYLPETAWITHKTALIRVWKVAPAQPGDRGK